MECSLDNYIDDMTPQVYRAYLPHASLTLPIDHEYCCFAILSATSQFQSLNSFFFSSITHAKDFVAYNMAGLGVRVTHDGAKLTEFIKTMFVCVFSLTCQTCASAVYISVSTN